MTNRQLIKILQKLPKDLEIAFRDHDQQDFEINNYVNNVCIVDFSENKSEKTSYNENQLRSGKLIILKS